MVKKLLGKKVFSKDDRFCHESLPAPDQVAILRATLDQDRHEKAELRTQNRELQSQLVKFAAEMQSILSRETEGKLSRWFRK